MARQKAESIKVFKKYLNASLVEMTAEDVIPRPSPITDPSTVADRFAKYSLEALNAALAAAAKFEAEKNLVVPGDAIKVSEIYGVFKKPIQVLQNTGKDLATARKIMLDKFKTDESLRAAFFTMRAFATDLEDDGE